MWDYDQNRLPLSLSQKFKKINTMHNFNTRASAHGNLYCPKVNTKKYGMKSFKYQGAEILRWWLGIKIRKFDNILIPSLIVLFYAKLDLSVQIL